MGVDPSSPFTGGAVLGDRIRLDVSDDIFIRSVASRGAHGGLSAQTESIVDVIDASGFDIIVIESVGVGQAEIAIAELVDTAVVVLVPESGDEIQAMKAGLLEIADLFCVNKADRPGAESLMQVLSASDALVGQRSETGPRQVVRSVATEPDGAHELVSALHAHRDMLDETGEWAARRDGRLRRRVRQLVRELWEASFWTQARRDELAHAVNQLDTVDRRPYSLASRIIGAGDSPN